MKRGDLLVEAEQTINGKRLDDYGAPEQSFQVIGDHWTIDLRAKGKLVPGAKIEPTDVVDMMILFKSSRETQRHKRDNMRDIAGYASIKADELVKNQ